MTAAGRACLDGFTPEARERLLPSDFAKFSPAAWLATCMESLQDHERRGLLSAVSKRVRRAGLARSRPALVFVSFGMAHLVDAAVADEMVEQFERELRRLQPPSPRRRF